MNRTVSATWCVFLLTTMWPGATLAYIDPGTGSMLIQGIIAAALGAGFAIKTYYRTHVKAFLDFILRRKRREEQTEGDTSRPNDRPHP